MAGNIRKISVGTNFPNNVIHYVVGQEFEVQGVVYKISDIIFDKEYTQLTGNSTYHIYVRNEHGTVKWNTIEDMPVKVEYNLSFE